MGFDFTLFYIYSSLHKHIDEHTMPEQVVKYLNDSC